MWTLLSPIPKLALQFLGINAQGHYFSVVAKDIIHIKLFCFFKNLAFNDFTLTARHFADKFSNVQEILGLIQSFIWNTSWKWTRFKLVLERGTIWRAIYLWLWIVSKTSSKDRNASIFKRSKVISPIVDFKFICHKVLNQMEGMALFGVQNFMLQWSPVNVDSNFGYCWFPSWQTSLPVSPQTGVHKGV